MPNLSQPRNLTNPTPPAASKAEPVPAGVVAEKELPAQLKEFFHRKLDYYIDRLTRGRPSTLRDDRTSLTKEEERLAGGASVNGLIRLKWRLEVYMPILVDRALQVSRDVLKEYAGRNKSSPYPKMIAETALQYNGELPIEDLGNRDRVAEVISKTITEKILANTTIATSNRWNIFSIIPAYKELADLATKTGQGTSGKAVTAKVSALPPSKKAARVLVPIDIAASPENILKDCPEIAQVLSEIGESGICDETAFASAVKSKSSIEVEGQKLRIWENYAAKNSREIASLVKRSCAKLNESQFPLFICELHAGIRAVMERDGISEAALLKKYGCKPIEQPDFKGTVTQISKGLLAAEIKAKGGSVRSDTPLTRLLDVQISASPTENGDPGILVRWPGESKRTEVVPLSAEVPTDRLFMAAIMVTKILGFYKKVKK